jgi:hypothetical protein
VLSMGGRKHKRSAPRAWRPWRFSQSEVSPLPSLDVNPWTVFGFVLASI